MSLEDAAQSLYNRLWKTRGCRFVAFERHKRINILSVTTIAILPVYVIILSLISLSLASRLSELENQIINIINICLSISIVVFSLIEFSRDHIGTANKLNESALEIGSIYGQFIVKFHCNSYTDAYVSKMENEYANILKKFPNNHSEVDFMVFKFLNPADFNLQKIPAPVRRLVILYYKSKGTYLYLFAITLPLAGAGLYVWLRTH